MQSSLDLCTQMLQAVHEYIASMNSWLNKIEVANIRGSVEHKFQTMHHSPGSNHLEEPSLAAQGDLNSNYMMDRVSSIWIAHCEQYIDMYDTLEKNKVALALYHLDDKA